MCMNQPDPAAAADAIQKTGPVGGNILTNLVRRHTTVGQQLDGGNRQAYMAYATDEQTAGRKPVPYAQWVQMNRHNR